MKQVRNFIYFFVATSCCLSLLVVAQDDLYYSPNQDYGYDRYDAGDQYASNDYYYDEDEEEDYVYYDDDEYDDYYYSSRIRRFHRPFRGFGYYDPCYVDRFWYGAAPTYWGSTIYVDPFVGAYGWAQPGFNVGYAGGWGGFQFGRPFRNFNRPWGWNRGWNRGWNSGWNNRGWNSGWNRGWNGGWNNWNSFYYPTFGSPYCPSVYASNVSYIYNDVTYVNNGGNRRDNYYGPRGGRTTNRGTVVSNRNSRNNGTGDVKSRSTVNQPRNRNGVSSSNSGYRGGANSARNTTLNGGYDADQSAVNSGRSKGSSYRGGKRTGVFRGGTTDEPLASRSGTQIRPRSGRYTGQSGQKDNWQSRDQNSFERSPKSTRPRSYDTNSRSTRPAQRYENNRNSRSTNSRTTAPSQKSTQKPKKRFWERVGSGDNGFFGSSRGKENNRSYDRPANSGSKSRSYQSKDRSRSNSGGTHRAPKNTRPKSYGGGSKRNGSKGKSFNFGGGSRKGSGVSRPSRSKSRSFSKPRSSSSSKRSGAVRSSSKRRK